MAQEKLLASVRLGYAKLQEDVNKINLTLKKINSGNKDILLNVKIQGFDQTKFNQLSNRLSILVQQFTRLNNLILNINKNSKGLGNISNIVNRVPQTTTQSTGSTGSGSANNLGNIAAIQGVIQRQVENISKSNKTVSSSYQNQQGLITRVTQDESGKIVARSREIINANTQLQRSINSIINSYRQLSDAEKKDINNVRNTISALDTLAGKYDQNSAQYKKIMSIKERMIAVEQKLAETMRRQPLQETINKYRMLSTEQQKMPTNIQRVISEIDKLIAKEQAEGREISKLIQLRNQYQRTYAAGVATAASSMNQMEETIRRRGLGELFGMSGVSGSGDRRATVMDRVYNSFIYATSAMAISQVYTSIRNLVTVNQEFEVGLINLARTMDNVSANAIERLGESALNTAKKYGIALKEIQDAQTELARAGIGNEKDLNQLTETVALGLNTTEIKNASEMVGYLISTIKQLNLDMSESNTIIDQWNYLSDKYAVHSNDFAEAVTKAGASSRMLGLELEDVNSMVVVLGERTQASGREIGNAIKTLESYLLRPETVKTLESYGVAVKKNAEEFLDFKTIMGNVDEALERFGENTQASDEILRTIGGTWRRNWIALLADSWDEIDGINRKQSEAIGYSAQENEKVMQTYAKQVELLKVSFSELGLEIGRAGLFDVLKGAVSALNTVTKGFQSLTPELRSFLVLLGEIFLVIKLSSLGMMKVFNLSLIETIMKTTWGLKQMKNVTLETTMAQQYLGNAMQAGRIDAQMYNAMLTGLNNKQKVRNLTVEQAQIQERAYALAMRETAQTSRSVAAISTIATLGATLAITGLITAIHSWNAAQEEAERKMEETMAKHKENNKILEETLDYYVKNKDAIETDDNVRNQLIETQKQLIELYGDEADGIDLVNGKVDENIKKLKEKTKLEKESLLQTLRIKIEANKQEKYIAPVAKEGFSIIDLFQGKTEGASLGTDSSGDKIGYQEYYDKLESQLDALISGSDELIAKELSLGEATKLSVVQKSQLIDQLNKQKLEVEPLITLEKQFGDLQREITRDRILDTVELNKEEQKLYDNMIGAFNDVDVKKYDKSIKTLIKNIKQFDTEIKKGTAKDNSLLSSILPTDSTLDLEKVIGKAYPEMFNTLTDSVGNYEDAISNAKSAVQQLKSAQEELSSSGKLTEDNLVAILEYDSTLLSHLNDRKALQQAINKATADEAKVAQAAYVNKILNSKAFFDNMLLNNKKLFTMLASYYGDDVKNFASLANAKSKVEATLIKHLGSNWKLYYKSQREALDAQIRTLKISIAGMGGLGAVALGKQLNELYRLRDMMDEITRIEGNIKTISFPGASFSNVGSGSGGSSSDTAKEALVKDRYFDINALIERQNMLLQRNKNLQEYQKEINGDLEYRIKLMNQELSLAQQQMKNQAKLQDMLRSERNSLEATLKKQGVSFSGSGDDKYINNAKSRLDKLTDLVNKYRNSTSASGKKAYETYKKQLEELETNINRFNQIQYSELPNAVQEWRELDLAIRDIKESLSELKIEKVLDGFIKATERYTKALKGVDYEIQRLGGETELAKTSDLVMEKVRLITDEVNNQRYALNQLLAVTDASVLSSEAYKNQLESTQDSLRQNILTLQELTKQQKENAKSAIGNLESRINSILDKGIELRKEALNEELDLYKEHVDSIIKERERQYEAEDFEKNLQDEYKNRQELVNKINRLNLDSSLESYNQRKELEKQLEEFDTKIADLKEQRQRDLIKQNLEDNVAAKESETSEAIKLIDEEFDIIKRRALIHETIMSESFGNLQTMLPELFQTLGTGINDFFETFESYEEHFGETLGDVSQKFADDILPQLENAFTAIDTYEERAAKMQIQALQLKYDNTSDKDMRMQYKQQADSIMKQYGFEYEDLRFADLNSGFYTTGETPTQQEAQSTLDTASITADPKFQEEKAKLKIRDLQIAYVNASESERKVLAEKANAIRDIWGWSYEDLKQWTPTTYDEQTLRSYSGGLNKGLVTQTGKYLLHGNPSNPEWVLTNSQMFNLVKNLATTIPSTTNNYSDKNDIIVNIPIYGNVDNGVVNNIKKAGTQVVHEIKKSLNKKGYYK